MFVNAVSLGRLYLVPGEMRLGAAIGAMGPSGSRLGLLAGWILFALAVHGRSSWRRLIGMAAILIAAVAGHEQSLLVNSATIAGLLILIAHGDTLATRVRRHR